MRQKYLAKQQWLLLLKSLRSQIHPYFSKMLDMLKAIAYVVNTAIKEIKIVLLAYWFIEMFEFIPSFANRLISLCDLEAQIIIDVIRTT